MDSITISYKDLKNLNIIHLEGMRENPITKITRATKALKNGLPQPKTFFPDHWPVEHLLENAQEALLNITKPIVHFKNIYQLIGITKNNIEIEFIIDAAGNIITFYPTQC